MAILLTGANGFIGRNLVYSLIAAGHEIVCLVRNAKATSLPQQVRVVEADFAQDFDPTTWLTKLAGIDIIINTVGILRETKQQTFEAIHGKGPRALFTAAEHAGVRLIIQMSALGADQHAASRYHLSKKQTDDFLMGLSVPSIIVQPSLIYGPDGASARLFTTLASLPLIPLPGSGEQQVQPIYIDNVVEAIVALLDNHHYVGQRIPLVGPEPLSLREFLARLRQSMGLGKAHFLAMPMPIARFAANIGEILPHSLFDMDSLAMLNRGNTADPHPVTQLLGQSPRNAENFITPTQAPGIRACAKLAWLLPLLRFSVALVWIFTGIVSFGLYPVEQSYALLSQVGLTGNIASLMLYGAATLDIVFGLAILFMRRRKLLWLAQILIILSYSVIITWRLPEFWLHPYGPLLKNIPLLAVIWLLYEFEERKWNTR